MCISEQKLYNVARVSITFSRFSWSKHSYNNKSYYFTSRSTIHTSYVTFILSCSNGGLLSQATSALQKWQVAPWTRAAWKTVPLEITLCLQLHFFTLVIKYIKYTLIYNYYWICNIIRFDIKLIKFTLPKYKRM
jgi:hypothetical protein